jgi:hypothetical protein
MGCRARISRLRTESFAWAPTCRAIRPARPVPVRSVGCARKLRTRPTNGKNPDQAAGASRRSGETAASASRIPDNLHRLRWAPRSCRATIWSYALENLRASHPCQATIRGDVCHDPRCCDGRRADKASGPDRGRSAIWRPIPRRLEYDPRTSNASCRIIGNCGTWTRRAADENSGEISRGRVDRQNLQERAPLTLPNSGYQALGRRRSNRYEKKKHSGGDAVHILLQGVVVNPDGQDD